MTTTIADTAPPEPIDIAVADVPVALRRAGSGRTVLYLHGAFFPTAWTPLHDTLAAKVDLVAPLHPGYAEGGPPDWLRGFDDLVLHYRSLLDTLDLTQVDLVGYDLGGWIGAQFAAFYPERVRSFTAIAPSGLWVPEAPMFEFLAASPHKVAAAIFNDEVEGYEDLFPTEVDIDAFVQAYGENGVTARLIWECRYDIRLERRLARLTMPSLVIAPREDRIVPPVHAQRWVEHLPDSRLVSIDDVGHGLVLQAPGLVAEAVITFLSEVPA